MNVGDDHETADAASGSAPQEQAAQSPGPIPIAESDAMMQQCQRLEEERDHYRDLLQRTRADFENYQKRMRREIDAERRYAVLPLVREVLPVLDNMRRALQVAATASDTATLLQGVSLVARQLEDVLERNQISPITALGMLLDPNFHEAVGQFPTAQYPAQTVVEELEKGYQLHDRVVRPSKVIVAQPLAETPEET